MAAGIATLWLLAVVPVASESRPPVLVTDPLTGMAIGGFDPVAYFVDGQARRGYGDVEGLAFGHPWRFVNDGNRAAFLAKPDVFTPRYGGYDPVGLARAVPLAGRGELFAVVDDRLYLFATPQSRAAFLADPVRLLAAAEANWPDVARGIAR